MGIIKIQEVEDFSDVFAKIKMNIWLLSPGSEADAAMFMSPRHTLMEYGYAVDCTDFYVCPVVRLSLDAE